MKQVRGKHPWSASSNHAGLSNSLVTAVLGSDYATPRAKRPPQRRGLLPGAVPRPGAATKEHDTVILEVRRLFEIEGLGCATIRKHMSSLGIEMTIDRVHSIVNYTTRAHLIPTQGSKPYFTGEQPCTTSTPSTD